MKTNNKRRKDLRQKKSIFVFFSKKKQTPRPTLQMKRKTHTEVSIPYLLALMLVVIVIASAFMFHLYVRFEGVWLGYETSRVRAERARLLVERRELRLELASLKSPERVAAEAREKLGMEVPDHKSIVPIGKRLAPVLASGRAR